MALPFLPGNTLNKNLGKTKFHKSQHFDLCNNVAMLVGEYKPGIGGERLPFQKSRPSNSKFPKGEGSNLPAWVAFDRQVLSFDAYFLETSIERREEQYTVRNCKIYFYLEDDSIQIIEPRLKCAGTTQGNIVRRHRIPKPPPNDGDFYTIHDFNVGEEVSLYSKVFKITDCDQFTYNFLKKMGIRIGPKQVTPDDPYQDFRKGLEETMNPHRPYERYDPLKQFLEHDRHVLRFYCYWDDTDNLFGDPRQFVLHYFLSDDTVEIREVIPDNSGRDAVGMFLRRAPLPKNVEGLKQHGADTNRTVLNVFGPIGDGRRYILDSLKTGALNTDFYKDHDLTIGAVINVWGRKFVLCDCDEFTREYYRTKYGINDFTPVKWKIQQQSTNTEKEPPPYNGFGTEEDSLANCMNLIPKPPKGDFVKFMVKDRQGLESNILRFLARMDTQHPIDKDRRFIISYFRSDDTILVFEPPVRNSGVIGGKFLERGRIKKPDQMRYSPQLSEYYMAPDLYVGAHLNVNKHKFIVIDADEYAFHYMEQHPEEFPKSNPKLIMEKIRAKLNQKREEARTFFTSQKDFGGANYGQLHNLLQKVDPSLTDQEVITLARYFALMRPKCIDSLKLLSIAQVELRKRNFDGFNVLLDRLTQEDKTKSGYIAKQAVRNALLSNHVPLTVDVIDGVIDVATVNEKGEVAYPEFLHRLNWRDYPLPPWQCHSVNADEDWPAPHGVGFKYEGACVDYDALLDAMFGKPDDAQ